MKKLVTTLAVGALTAAVGGVMLVGAGNAFALGTQTPWAGQDQQAVGGITFFNSAGTQITSGSTSSAPFAAYAEGQVATRATDTKAALFAYVPQVGQTPDTWTTSEQIGASTTYPNASAPAPINTATTPVNTGAAGDETLDQVAADLPSSSTQTGYVNAYEIRMYTAQPGHGTSVTYDYADITINTSTHTWTEVYSPNLVVTKTSGPTSLVGVAYPATTLTATGGTGTLVWSVLSGTLPPGLVLATTGKITGTPTTPGTYNFAVGVHDASKPTVKTGSASITIAITPMSVAAITLPGGVIGKAYVATTLKTSGGKTPFVWTKTTGSLPPGITLSTAGKLAGTPTASGTFTFGVSVHDSTKPTANVATANETIVVAPITITTATLPSGLVGKAYTATTFKATGGKTPLVWTVSVGPLPAGLTLTTAGKLSGTPTVSGSFPITVQVADANTPKNLATANYTIVIAPMTITTASLPAGTVGKAYSAKLVVSGGKTPLVFAKTSGTLPPGVTFSTAGAFAGKPTTAGSYTFTVQVTDASKPTANTATATYTITVS